MIALVEDDFYILTNIADIGLIGVDITVYFFSLIKATTKISLEVE
jgi:hypothetical protein